MKTQFGLSLLIVALFTLPSLAGEEHHKHSKRRHHQPHEHGAAEVKIALEGESLNLQLDIPAEDVLGFEHKPKNDAQKAQRDEALQYLKSAAWLTVLPASACTLKRTKVEYEADGRHAEFENALEWKCTSAPREITIKLFEKWPSVKTVRAECSFPKGQEKRDLTANSPTIIF